VNDSLKGFTGAVRDDIGVEIASVLRDSKHRCFTVCTTAASPFDPPGAEVGFGDPLSDHEQISICHIADQAS